MAPMVALPASSEPMLKRLGAPAEGLPGTGPPPGGAGLPNRAGGVAVPAEEVPAPKVKGTPEEADGAVGIDEAPKEKDGVVDGIGEAPKPPKVEADFVGGEVKEKPPGVGAEGVVAPFALAPKVKLDDEGGATA